MVEADVDAVAAIHYHYAKQGRFSDHISGTGGAVTVHQLGVFYRQNLGSPAAPFSMRVAVGHSLGRDGQEVARVIGFYAILSYPDIQAQELMLLAVSPTLPATSRMWRNSSVGERLFMNMLAHSRKLGGRRGLLVARTNTLFEIPARALVLLDQAGFHNIGAAKKLAVHIRPSGNGSREWIRACLARGRVLRYFRR